jgi:hypothetical protein
MKRRDFLRFISGVAAGAVVGMPALLRAAEGVVAELPQVVWVEKVTKTLIAGACTIAPDVQALDLFGLMLEEVAYLQEAIQRGLQKFDLGTLTVKKISLT